MFSSVIRRRIYSLGVALLFATASVGVAQGPGNKETSPQTKSPPPATQSKSSRSTRTQQDEVTPTASELIRNATTNANDRINRQQKYQLAYKLKKGQQLRWNVEHTASTKTRMANQSEKTSSRSQSVKLWTVDSVDTIGNMIFVHSIESVSVWQQTDDDEPIAYDSNTGGEPPAGYEAMMEKIGVPLATITINQMGQVVDRKTTLRQARFGAGEITVPLPKEPISIGYKWYVPGKLAATDENGRNHQLKTRIHHELANVKGNNAYISFRTEVLTPIESDKIRSQIMQQMTKGYLVFDMKNGRPLRKEVEWDERVQGFEGPDSYLNYVGKMTERLMVSETDGKGPAAKTSKKSSPAKIKKRGDKAIMRK